MKLILFLLLKVLSLLIRSEITRYHGRVPVGCQQFCYATQRHEKLIYPTNISIVPIFNTEKQIHIVPYNPNFLIHRKLAEGASAEVYLVQDSKTSQLNIVKRYFDTEDKTEFEQQNYIMDRMGYNIKWSLSPIYNQIISIHPYYQSKNFTDLKLSSKDLKIVMYKLIQQVNKAHQNGIIHSDIKPQNILVDAKLQGRYYISQKFKVQLIDWNLATIYYLGKKYDRASGTPPCKAPELVIQAGYYTPAVDVWSLGISMYQVIAQQTLVASEFQTEVYEMIRIFGFERFMEFYDQIRVIAEPDILYQILDAQNFTSQFQKKMSSKRFNNQERDFIKRMLVLEPWNRPSCSQLLNDAYFNDLKYFKAPLYYKHHERASPQKDIQSSFTKKNVNVQNKLQAQQNQKMAENQ